MGNNVLYPVHAICGCRNKKQMLEPVFSMLENISDRESQGAWRQDELICGKPLVVT
jgi:hypothetical protein